MGGVYAYSQCLLEAVATLSKDGFEVVVAYTDPIWAPQIARVGVQGLHLSSAKWTFGLGTLLTWSGFPVAWWHRLSLVLDPNARRLVKAHCDLWIFSSFSFVCYQMPVRGVGVIHDLMHRYERRFPESGSFFTYHWRERVFRRMCRWTTGLLVDSELGKRQVVESYGVDPRKIHVLPFTTARRVDADVDCDGIRARYELPDKFLFYPAQFWEHKNHKRLVHAIVKLDRECPDISLVLIGSKKNGYDSLVSVVGELGVRDKIRFLGFVPQNDLTGIYRLARAMIFPSFYGPTNIPPLEAFALGCPVAVSNIYGMPEQVGDAGLLFDPESVDSIADAVRRLWTDDALCALLAQRGRKRASEWGPDQFHARLRATINAALSRSSLES